MSSPLEPSDVGPAVGGNLPASDSDRDHVITLLTAAHAEGRLTLAERDERIAAARVAETFDDLVPLTRDLVTVEGISTFRAPTAGVPVIDTVDASPDADLVVTIFGGTERRGAWRVREHTSVLNLFGGTELDMTRAIFESATVSINVFCLFGGIDVIVPPGTNVRNEAIAIFGGSGAGRVAPPLPGAPTVIVRGFVGFGGVEIGNPKHKN